MTATDALARALEIVNGPKDPDVPEDFPGWEKDWADELIAALRDLGYEVRPIHSVTAEAGPPDPTARASGHGNTSAAAIPIALCEAIDQGRVYPGAHLGMVAFGAGLTWAATVVKWTAPVPTRTVSASAKPREKRTPAAVS